jgi:hypothetical protein
MINRLLILIMLPCLLQAQHQLPIRVLSDPAAHTMTVTAGGKPFTTFIYPDSLEKPVLYPIYAPDGQLATRGFPLKPRPGEPVDHPHHFGLWFNYENVNGLDFWNNSYAIPANKKAQYGWIRTDSASTDGTDLHYTAHWIDQQKKPLLLERTTFHFTANENEWIIDRFTKENVTKVAAGNTPDINGNYLTSEGKTGDSAWGTRAGWCMMYGKKQQDTLCIVIIDHPTNPGYPTYWHARGYGLFAANPLGQKIFSNGRQTMNYHLSRGKSVTFRYRIVLAAGSQTLSTDRIRQLADTFARIQSE